MTEARLNKNEDMVMDMTVGKPYQVIVKFAIPLFIGELFQQLYNAADTFIVGKFLGTEALAAVGSSGNLIFLFNSFFIGLGTGAGILIARFFGAGDEKNVSKSIHTTVTFGLLLGILMSTLGVIFSPGILKLMQTDPDVMPLAVSYFTVYFSGSITVVMYNFLKGIINAVGDSKRPLYYLIASSLLNIGLDCLFVGAFRWGVWSAALATVISQLISCVLCSQHLLRKGHVYTVSIKKLGLNKEVLKLIIKYGVPTGVQNSAIALANVLVQTQINGYGMYAMAAYGACSKVEGFAFIPVTSFTMAISTFVGQNLGAKKYDRAKKGSRFGIIAAVIIAEIVGILYFIFAKQIIGLFDSTPEVLYYGLCQVRVMTLFYAILAFAHAIAAVCRGAGKAFVPMLIMLSIWCVFRIAYILTITHFFHDIKLVYWAYPITWGISSIIYLIYYLKSDWVHGFENVKPKKKLFSKH